MTRFTPAAVALALAAGPLAAQPARVVGPTGPGLQPQLNTALYQTSQPTVVSRGVNPFAAPSYQPYPRVGQRPGAPVVVVPPVPAQNNPVVFNPGFMPQLPLLPVQPVAGVAPVGFNPLFVARPLTGYYVPPLAGRQPGTFRYTGYDERVNPASGTVHNPLSGTVSMADGSTFFRVPGVGPVANDSAGTGLYFNPDAGTYFNPASGIVFRPGEVRFLPWIW